MNARNNMNTAYTLRRSRVETIPKSERSPSNTGVSKRSEPSFNEVLAGIRESEEVKFSRHAAQRLDQRNIQLSQQDMHRLSEGVSKAKSKGVREALIVMDNKVFVASVKNRTIITAASDEQLKENVFTHIDGAVIV